MGSASTGRAPQQLTESPFKYLKWQTTIPDTVPDVVYGGLYSKLKGTNMSQAHGSTLKVIPT